MASTTLSNNQHRLLRRVKKVAYLIGLFLAMAIICLPGLWIVLSSLRPPVEIMAKPPVWIPQEITLDAYYAMFSGAGGGGIPVWDYFRNSLIISVTSTIIALIVGVSGGYAFARFRFWGKSTTFLGLMLTRSVPGIALSLPLFMLYSRIGIIDTHFGLIVTYVALNVPFTIWLIDGFSVRCRRIWRKQPRLTAAHAGRPSGRWSFHSLVPALRPQASLPSSLHGTNMRWLPSSPARSIPRPFLLVFLITPLNSPSTGAACVRWRS